MRLNTKYLSILLVLALAACSSGAEEPQGNDADPQEPVLLQFGMSREPVVNENGQGQHGYVAPGDQTAYRVVLIKDNLIHAQGTYRYAAATETGERTGLLIPCKVDDDGYYAYDDRESGCYSYNGLYTMLLFTPAVPLHKIEGLSNLWAFVLERPGVKPVYSSEALEIDVNGRGENRDKHYETIDMSQYDKTANNDPNGDYDPFTLRERRSRLRFELCIGEDLEEAHISKIELQRLYERAYYTPINQTYYIIKEEDIDPAYHDKYDVDEDGKFDCLSDYTKSIYTLPSGQDYLTLTKPNPIYLPDEDSAEATDTSTQGDTDADDGMTRRWINIFSMDYGEKDASFGKNIHDVPRLHIEFYAGKNTEGAYANVDLGFNFLAHYQYTFLVTINSSAVHITLYMTPWDYDGPSESATGTISREIGSYQIGWTDLEWTDEAVI